MKRTLVVISILTVLAVVFTALQIAAPVSASFLTDKPNKTHEPKSTEKAGMKATREVGKPEHSGKPEDKPTKPAKPGKPVLFRGQVAAVDATSLSITLKDGSLMTFSLDAKSSAKIPTKGKAALPSNLNIGVNVLVQAVKDETTGTYYAKRITVIPGKPVKIHRVGEVTAYTPGVSITIQDKKGNLTTFVVTASTKILPVHRADQLAVGSRVTIISPRDVTGGPLTAKGIVVHPSKISTETPEPTETITETVTETITETITETVTETPAP